MATPPWRLKGRVSPTWQAGSSWKRHRNPSGWCLAARGPSPPAPPHVRPRALHAPAGVHDPGRGRSLRGGFASSGGHLLMVEVSGQNR